MTLNATFPEGLGGTLGDSAATGAPFYSTGLVWYVHAGTGTNAAAPAGRNRARPLATLAQAQTNASDGDTVVLLDGHVETLTAELAITKALTILGEGESDGEPTVVYTNNSAAANCMSLDACAEIRNVKFATNSQANSAYRLEVTVAGCKVIGCWFDCAQYDDAAALRVTAATDVTIKRCTFVSTATATSAQPHSALVADGTVSRLVLEEVVFDGGTVGYSNFWAADFNTADAAAAAAARFEGLSLLRGADVLLPAGDAFHVKVIGPMTVTGGSVIEWNGDGGGV